MEANPTDPTGEMIDVVNSLPIAQEPGQTITWTHMFRTTTTATIAQENRVNIALRIPIGVRPVAAITDVSQHGGEVEALALEMGVEADITVPSFNANPSLQLAKALI
jgi:hypothetical protein